MSGFFFASRLMPRSNARVWKAGMVYLCALADGGILPFASPFNSATSDTAGRMRPASASLRLRLAAICFFTLGSRIFEVVFELVGADDAVKPLRARRAKKKSRTERAADGEPKKMKSV